MFIVKIFFQFFQMFLLFLKVLQPKSPWVPSAKLENILNELIIGSDNNVTAARNEITSEQKEEVQQQEENIVKSSPTRQEIIINREEREEPKHREVSVILQEIQQQLQFRNERTEVYTIFSTCNKIERLSWNKVITHSVLNNINFLIV